MTIAEDYLQRIKVIDEMIESLRKQSKQLFYEYMSYLNRMRDSQTDLCDFIKEKELKNNP